MAPFKYFEDTLILFEARPASGDSARQFDDNPDVRPWQVYVDPKTGRDTHTLPRGLGHSLLAPLVAYAFRVLRVSATVTDGRAWWAIHSEPSVLPFELEHGMETERFAYNQRNLDAAREKRKTIRGSHAGFHDLFIPIFLGGQVAAFLVVGPFGVSWPGSAEILERWRWLSGREGHLQDPEFAAYLASTLSTLVLDGDRAEMFERMLGYFARLLSGEGLADELTNQAWVLQLELKAVRAVEWAWEAVRTMIDDRFPRSWHSVSRTADLRDLGLSRAPDHVLVGLPAAPAAGGDAVDEALRRAALQRSATELARSVGDVISGKVGDDGVVFLSAGASSVDKKRKKLLGLADKVAAMAREQHGLSLHFGSGVASGSIPLSRTYREALAAAELAISRGVSMTGAVRKSSPPPQEPGLRGALDYIDKHYTEPLRVEQVAGIAGLAQNEFSRLFRKQKRATFEQYVIDLRLTRAKQLLSSTELNATRVAELSGFNSSQYFSRIFRSKLGETPLEYRARAGARAKK